MTVERKDNPVVCRHTENMAGYVATCSKCGQIRKYDDPDSNKAPTLIKHGRDPLTGRPTIVNPPPLHKERPDIKPAEPEVTPATTDAQHVPEETEISRHISMKPDDWGKMTAPQKSRWYDEHWAEFEADVEKLGLPAAQTKWQIADGTYRGILRRRLNAVAKPEPGGGVPPRPKRMNHRAMHDYYENNRVAILKDLEELGFVEMRKRWHIPGSTWISLKRRWPVGPVHETVSLVDETVSLVDETGQSVEQEDEDLVPVGARLERRNQGMTGFRRLYPL